MAKQRKAWMVGPAKQPKASLPGTLKDEVDTKAGELIEKTLKPRHVKPPPEGSQFNYVTDITTKWIGSTCSFISIYACPTQCHCANLRGEVRCMEYVGDAKFALSFMRHTGKWVALFTGISIDECMTAIRDDPWFMP